MEITLPCSSLFSPSLAMLGCCLFLVVLYWTCVKGRSPHASTHKRGWFFVRVVFSCVGWGPEQIHSEVEYKNILQSVFTSWLMFVVCCDCEWWWIHWKNLINFKQRRLCNCFKYVKLCIKSSHHHHHLICYHLTQALQHLWKPVNIFCYFLQQSCPWCEKIPQETHCRAPPQTHCPPVTQPSPFPTDPGCR